MSLLQLIQSDIAKANNSAQTFGILKLLVHFFFSRFIRTIILVRLLKKRGVVSFLSSRVLRKRHIEIGKNVSIKKGFFLPHPWCVIIADGSILGENVSVGQYVTIGGNFKKAVVHGNSSVQKLPVIGDRVIIGPGTVIGGPVTIGNDVIIGANAVVTHNVPSNSIVYGQNKISKKKIMVSDKGDQYSIIQSA
ncbi:hypothetical protein MHTCC0001_33880 [Flavobacteriaceae bacterium MHTCC 0001]